MDDKVEKFLVNTQGKCWGNIQNHNWLTGNPDVGGPLRCKVNSAFSDDVPSIAGLAVVAAET
ncbi:MAG TPA: hypothetical protein VFX43_00750 [Chitinophagaceae bacterium]|nr:hypothetical protein [Chitinophagaceae bacterium]